MSASWLKGRIAELVHAASKRGEPISVKEMRLRLEKESGRSLDSQREQIKALIHAASERAAESASESESESESEQALPSKKPASVAKKPPPPNKKENAPNKSSPAATTGALWESAPAKVRAKVVAARAAIKKAGLAPRLASIKGVRTMEAADVLSRLYAILESAGLGDAPTKQQLAEHAAKLALERELDGISTANIIAAPEAPGANAGRRLRRKIDEDDLYAPPSPAERNLDDADGDAEPSERGSGGGRGDRAASPAHDASSAAPKRRRAIVESDSE